MEKITAVSTANAGVVLEIGGHRLWVDAVHCERALHFSTVTEEMFDRLLADPDLNFPEAILFTHAHSDHFSRTSVRRVLEAFPETEVFIEGNKGIDRQIRLRETEETFERGDLKITFFKIPHDSEKFAGVKHYGILLDCKDTKILFPGDTHVGNDELFAFLEEKGLLGNIDLCFYNFPWVALNTGRDAMEKIGARHAVFFHLPFEGDDAWGYRRQVFRLADRYKGEKDWRIFGGPFQKETF